MSTSFTVHKAKVYTEVAKTTSYGGAKKTLDGSSYETVFTKDEDRIMLERFWNEAANAVTDIFKPFIVKVSSAEQAHDVDLGQDYVAELSMPGSFDTTLVDSIQSSLFSFFTDFIVSRWYKFADKEDAQTFESDAAMMLEDVKAKIYFRKKPKRIIPG